jgi:hypothetical protein
VTLSYFEGHLEIIRCKKKKKKKKKKKGKEEETKHLPKLTNKYNQILVIIVLNKSTQRCLFKCDVIGKSQIQLFTLDSVAPEKRK